MSEVSCTLLKENLCGVAHKRKLIHIPENNKTQHMVPHSVTTMASTVSRANCREVEE